VTTLFSKGYLVYCVVILHPGTLIFENENSEAVTDIGDFYKRMTEDACSTTGSNMDLPHNIFQGRTVSHFGDVPRPAHSPDSLAPDYVSWQNLKRHANDIFSCTTDILKR
jgi:hypothetical protein